MKEPKSDAAIAWSCFKSDYHHSRVFPLTFSEMWMPDVKLFDVLEYVDEA